MKVALITGTSGRLGRAFYGETVCRYGDDVGVILLQRRPLEYSIRPQDRIIYADLVAETGKIERELARIDLGLYDEAYYVHTVGSFETEGALARYPDMTKEQMVEHLEKSNVQSFPNTMYPYLKVFQKECSRLKPVRAICFGSISDRHNILYWSTYSETKNALREQLRQISKLTLNFHAVMANLPSVDTENEERLRPNADKSFWLTCEEVAKHSLAELDAFTDSYLEVDIFRPMHAFTPEIYFRNLNAIKEKWQREMRTPEGGEASKEVRREIPIVTMEIAREKKLF